MEFGRHIAGLASAALVAAVMLFAPASAQAHVGHDHGRSAGMPHTVAVTASKPALNTSSVKEVRQASTASQDQTFGHAKDVNPDANCSGGCCGNGLGCCGAALLVRPQELPEIVSHRPDFPAELVYRQGIDPDALKRPPRTLV